MPYVLFMDESGDHNLENIDPNFSAFCLAGCIFERDYYKNVVRPSVEGLKNRFWGRTDVILHSSDIRKHRGAFSFLGSVDKRQEFYEAINDLLAGLDMTILAAVILKKAHLSHYGDGARHPYHLSLEFLMERYSMMMRRKAKNVDGYMMAESRGVNEDHLLKNEFFNLKRFGTRFQTDFDNVTNFWMEKKKANIAGLQIADLVAYPIAAKVLRPDLEQRSFEIVSGKLDKAPASKGGGVLGYGLKIFPQPTFEHFTAFK
ncbi:MAG: DUF3800 domain-containing protein [Chloroflexi bacterium]|nr:DUF3800 domain-containing protein [Chloroflexota bacterium]